MGQAFQALQARRGELGGGGETFQKAVGLLAQHRARRGSNALNFLRAGERHRSVRAVIEWVMAAATGASPPPPQAKATRRRSTWV